MAFQSIHQGFVDDALVQSEYNRNQVFESDILRLLRFKTLWVRFNEITQVLVTMYFKYFGAVSVEIYYVPESFISIRYRHRQVKKN